jgi:hypothetical protein
MAAGAVEQFGEWKTDSVFRYTCGRMNAAVRPRLVVAAVFIFLAGLTTFAQPGICPGCLIGDVHNLHPHPGGHPERPYNLASCIA